MVPLGVGRSEVQAGSRARRDTDTFDKYESVDRAAPDRFTAGVNDGTPGSPAAWATLLTVRMPAGAATRARIHRRLLRTGALAVRPGVYALPDTPAARQAFAAARHDIDRLRGAALPGVMAWLDPRDTVALAARHAAERATRERRLSAHIALLERLAGSARPSTARQTANARLARLRTRLSEGTATTTASRTSRAIATGTPLAAPELAGRTWVTRRGVRVDRIASAWFVRRFVDATARFRFVASDQRPGAGEVGFDMADVPFTHDGARCTCEVLAARFAPDDAALRAIGEIVHDLDVRDHRYGREEAPGLDRMLTGLTALEPDDHVRLERGGAWFDCLYASLRPPAPQLSKGVPT